MSVRPQAIQKGELPNLSLDELNYVMDLVKISNMSPDEAFRKAKEIVKNKKNGEQRGRPAENKDEKKRATKKSQGSSSLSSQASLKSISAPMEIQQKSHIYGVSTPGGRRTLQIDFVSKTFNFISGGQIQQSFKFLDLRSYDVDEAIANELVLRFEDRCFEINTDSTEEKYGLERLLSTVLELNDLERIGVNLNPAGTVVSPEQMLIKRGKLMKRGNTAIPVWAERMVKIQTGEFCFYRAGDAVAINVVRLWEGNAKFKARGNDGLVIQMRAPDTRIFCFRVCSDGHKDSSAIKQERNDWLKAFKKACITRRSTLKLTKDQIQKLSLRSNQAAGEQTPARKRVVIGEGQFTSPTSPSGQASSSGSIGYSTGRSTASYTESPTISRDSLVNANVYETPECPRDEAIGTSSDDDSGEFEDEEVFYNSIPTPYAHQEAEVLGLLADAISVEDIPGDIQGTDEHIYGNEISIQPPTACPNTFKDPPYARKIIQADPTIQAPAPKNDSLAAPGFVISHGGKDISWQPDTNVVTTLPIPVPPVSPPMPPPPAPPPMPLTRDCSNRIKLKHIFWKAVPPNQVEKSIWQHSRPDELRKKLNLSVLEDQFSLGPNRQLSGTTAPTTSQQTLVGGKRAYNLGIFLKGLKTRGRALIQSLSQVNEEDSALSVEQVATIRRFQPTVEDCEMYNNYSGNKSKLGEVDQFMMELCKIPELENRLDLTQLLWEFPHQLHCLEPTVEQMTRTCNQLNTSQKFARVLQYILCLGNYLNSSSPSGLEVKGFHLAALNSLADTRGKDRDYSLLHYLVDQLAAVEPELLNFQREIPDIHKCSESSTKALEVEIEVLKNQLTLIRKTIRSLRAGLIHPASYEAHFLDEAEKFAKHHDRLLEQLQVLHNQLHHSYISVLHRFGQPMETSSNQLFTAICEFMEKFEAINQERSARQQAESNPPISVHKASGKAKVPLPQKKSTNPK
ncbi:uncharacterized protein LOC135475161 [Liolophura sinensis]|uniref:uncharacterized protein LOC135475161 n=1 Tax=Liolophura sinensis TaxID=3198878 RepID=UPI0031590DB8